MNKAHEITQKSYEQLESVFNKPLEQPKEEKQKKFNFKIYCKGNKNKTKRIKTIFRKWRI